MDYCLVDLETGGLVAANHAIMSVGLLRLNGDLNPIEERYWTVFDPLKIVTEEALAVNHLEIDPATATPVDKLLAELEWYFQDATLCAHNAPFDIGWLNNRGNYGILTAIDTMMLSWKFWPSGKAKLGILAERLNLKIVDAHNSLGDVLTMSACLKAMFDTYGEEAVLTPQKIDWYFWAKKYRGTKPQWVPGIGALSQT